MRAATSSSDWASLILATLLLRLLITVCIEDFEELEEEEEDADDALVHPRAHLLISAMAAVIAPSLPPAVVSELDVDELVN